MKESNKIGLLLLAICVVFSYEITEFFIVDARGLIIMGIMFLFIPIIQWAVKEQKKAIEEEENERKRSA